MKTLTAKQIEQIKGIKVWDYEVTRKNQKWVGKLPVALYNEVIRKKRARSLRDAVSLSAKSPAQLTRHLISWSVECKDTNYFKVLIEGNKNIYYAHPNYGHSDYNKKLCFEKNEKTLKLMALFNSYIEKKVEMQ